MLKYPTKAVQLVRIRWSFQNSLIKLILQYSKLSENTIQNHPPNWIIGFH